jgi:hypothetical protein
MKRALWQVGLVALVSAAGCKKETVATHVTTTQGPGALPADHPPVDLPAVSRTPRRLSVDQLIASIDVVANKDPSTPTVTWNQDKDTIKRTLGKPDYILITDEDLSPSTLYMKFMDDLAHDVCNKMIAQPAASQVLMANVTKTDTLVNNPAKVKQNLRDLYLRFFGRKVQPTDETTIAPMLKVFDQVVQVEANDSTLPSSSTPATEGWRAVCVASFTSPDFHLY